jgi:hypothetical protein
VDLVMRRERKKMDSKIKSIHEETESSSEMDWKVMQERAAMDLALKQEHEKMEKWVKKIHKDMNEKL